VLTSVKNYELPPDQAGRKMFNHSQTRHCDFISIGWRYALGQAGAPLTE
jgi:hypothetical protein